MTKEVGEIISKMEENMSSPIKTFQSFANLIYKVIGKGDFEEMRR
jgi:hypothetical protein